MSFPDPMQRNRFQLHDVILKDRAAVRRPAVKRLLAGAAPERSDLLDPADPEAFTALRQFCSLRNSLGATGRTIVAYVREAWNAKDNDDVRITFDRKIA